jgi:hypothetical protein
MAATTQWPTSEVAGKTEAPPSRVTNGRLLTVFILPIHVLLYYVARYLWLQFPRGSFLR